MMKKIIYAKLLLACAMALTLVVATANSQIYSVKGNDGWGGTINETNPSSADIDGLKIMFPICFNFLKT